MTDDEILEVVQAHKDGKRIEVYEGASWKICAFQPPWNFGMFDYRVAPEPRKPREWWICPNPKHEGFDFAYSSGNYPLIRVREVIEPSRDQRTWFAEFPLDGGIGQIFTDPRQLTKGGKLVEVMEIL